MTHKILLMVVPNTQQVKITVVPVGVENSRIVNLSFSFADETHLYGIAWDG